MLRSFKQTLRIKTQNQSNSDMTHDISPLFHQSILRPINAGIVLVVLLL